MRLSQIFFSKKSFTLIEMLIVIVIIGILAAALIPRLQSVQGRARDSKRKVDLRTIYNANEIHMVDKGRYAALCPATGCNTSTASTLQQPWIAELSGILTSIPQDPLNVGYTPWITGQNTYLYGDLFTGTSTDYDLTTKLENPQDPDRCELKQYNYRESDLILYPFCGGTGRSAGHPNLKYIYEYSPSSKSF